MKQDQSHRVQVLGFNNEQSGKYDVPGEHGGCPNTDDSEPFWFSVIASYLTEQELENVTDWNNAFNPLTSSFHNDKSSDTWNTKSNTKNFHFNESLRDVTRKKRKLPDWKMSIT